MEGQSEPVEGKPAKRGDAAWKEELTRIAERNDKARKEGKERRDAYAREKEDRRQTADRHERAAILAADEKRRRP